MAFAVAAIIAAASTVAQADPAPMSTGVRASDQFIEWETQHNPIDWVLSITKLDGGWQPIPHIEFEANHAALPFIPSYEKWLKGADRGPNLLTIDFARYLPREIRDALLFKRDGKRWVRWPLSPYDTKYGDVIEQYLRERGVPFKRVASYFRGRTTSSRSLLIKDPRSRHEFSFKTSTSATAQGTFKSQDRPYPVRWAYLNRLLSDYYYSQRGRLKHLAVAWEAAMLGLPPVRVSSGEMVDAAMTVRLMEGVNRNETYQMSAFVLGDAAEVARLAAIAGMTPGQYVRTLSEIFGQGLAELNVVLGFVMTSAHSQNVRFELDRYYRPTGRLIILDLTDGHPVRAIFERNGATRLLEQWANLTHTDNQQRRANQIVDLAIDQSTYGSWDEHLSAAAVKTGLKQRLRELTNLNEEELSVAVTRRGIGIAFSNREHLAAMLKDVPSNCEYDLLGY